jgi:hypothetical protein
MTTTTMYASSPVWELVKHGRKFQLRWRGSPASNPQPVLDGHDLDVRLSGNGRAFITMDQAVDAVVALGLDPHWGVPGAPQFKGRLRAALEVAAS